VLAWDAFKAIHDQVGAAYGFVGQSWRDYSASDIWQLTGPVDKVWDKLWLKNLDAWYKQITERSNYRRSNAKPTENTRFANQPSPQKIGAFTRWLKDKYAEKLGTDRPSGEYWERYIREGFRKGMARSYDEANRMRRLAGEREFQGGKEQFLRTETTQPATLEQLQLLVAGTQASFSGLDQRSQAQLVRILADGLVKGSKPLTIARNMTRKLDLSLKEAERIARTEIVRAQAEGQLTALERQGFQHVGVQVEWTTADDGKVCPECQDMEGEVFDIDEAHGLIPLHPNCRCSFQPYFE
jgi:SPP1 gp7 family putative phage head morphogenesis protein